MVVARAREEGAEGLIATAAQGPDTAGPDRATTRRFLAKYADDEHLLLHDLVRSHEDALGPAYIVEASFKRDHQQRNTARNRYSIIVKNQRRALDITAALFDQGLIERRFQEQVTLFAMKAVLKRGIFAFGLDHHERRLLKIYTEFSAKTEGPGQQARIECLAVVDNQRVKVKAYQEIEPARAVDPRLCSLDPVHLHPDNIRMVYGVWEGSTLAERHILLKHHLPHRDHLDFVSVVAVKAHEVTYYLRPNPHLLGAGSLSARSS